MDKLLAKLTRYKGNSQKLRSFRYLFFGIVVLTVFNLGANLFNSYMAFAVKADNVELRAVQDKITANKDKIEELNQQKIDKSEMRQVMLDSRATIQSIIIKSSWHLIPQKDKDFILANWENAEYELAGETPPPQ